MEVQRDLSYKLYVSFFEYKWENYFVSSLSFSHKITTQLTSSTYHLLNIFFDFQPAIKHAYTHSAPRLWEF